MIDRAARAEVCAAFEVYFNKPEEIAQAATKLLAVETVDETVRYVLRVFAELIEDDLQLAYADKADWDYLQRLRLVLASDEELVVDRRYRWHVSQGMAAATLAILALLYWNVGVEWIVLAALGAAVGLGLNEWRNRVDEAEAAPDPFHCKPFKSLAELARARARAANFRKVRYPHEWKPGPAGPLTDLAWTLATSLTTRMFAPLFLLYLASPLLRDSTRVGPRRTQKCRMAE